MDEARISLLVFGLHLSGQPLNAELLDLGATLVGAAVTAPSYRMVLLKRGEKRLPGIWRDPNNGASLEGEVWSLPEAALGAFFVKVPHPLCLGTLELEDGTWVKGFLCEAVAYAAAEDISEYGGWRGWMKKREI
jgi:allophanate hydrolase